MGTPMSREVKASPIPRPLPEDASEVSHSLMERSPVPMAELEGAGHIVRYVNPAFCQLVGKSKQALVGNPFAETVLEGDGCLAAMDRVYHTEKTETYTESEHPGSHPVYWSYAIWPVLGADQTPVGVMMQVTETTRFHQPAGAMNEALVLSSVRQHELIEQAEKLNEQLQAEVADRKAGIEALRKSEERYRALFDLGPVAVYSCDTSGVIQEFNRRSSELWGREPASGDTEERFCGSHKLFRADGSFMPHEQCPMAEVLSGKISETRGAEVLIERPDGSRITVIVNIRPQKNGSGDIIGAINCFYDITERKQHEEHQKMLLNELSHRVKNTLATVQSIAMQTMQNAPTIEAFQDAFESRLVALASTHNLLLQNPSQVVSLRDLAASELSHYAADDDTRFTIEGDDVSLRSERAVPIGMMFHELATNAAKYGALSVLSGRVAVSWTLGEDAGTLHLQWVETDGPAVKRPSRRGFGSRLIERGLAHELGANVRLIFDPCGVRCVMDIPLPPVAEMS
jgi:PAS domain S-box-containing protein